jgi:hypothetical protein
MATSRLYRFANYCKTRLTPSRRAASSTGARQIGGLITVELTNREDGIWLSVEDTGIGMSEAVLTGSLLDFGTSFWGSTRMVEEFPGLAAKGMVSLGKFGIGFFSVSMLGDHVRVITRRPDRAESDALLLEFQDGISSRPVLSTPPSRVIPTDGGTRVEIRLRWDPRVADGITLGKPVDPAHEASWARLGGRTADELVI